MRIIFPPPSDGRGTTVPHTLSVECPGDDDLLGVPPLLPIRLSGHEAINSLFEYELLLETPEYWLLSRRFFRALPLDKFIGRPIRVTIELDGGELREINALIAAASVGGANEAEVRYRLTLRPWLHLAELRTDCRIFQAQTIVRTLEDVLSSYPFPVEKRLGKAWPAREYVTQYNESDFAFFERITQEWGINYFFVHAEGKHRLVLCTSMPGYEPNPGEAYRRLPFHAPGWKTEAEYVERFEIAHRLVSGRYSTLEYDYTRPGAELSFTQASPRPTEHAEREVFQFRDPVAGCFFVQPAAPAPAESEFFEGPFTARVRMEALRGEAVRAQGAGRLRGMVPGCTFELFDHPDKATNANYLILEAALLVEDIARTTHGPGQREPWRVEASFSVHPAAVALRPALLRRKPLCSGTQPAVVVGPPGESLWTDSYGRVKVRFRWDRRGEKNEQSNARSSCWVRVGSSWAGNQLGLVQLPRIGQEVLVGFEGGDTDLPVVLGSVHNQFNLPPWCLPEQSALSGIRSRELVPGQGNGAGGRSNQLVFDDTEQAIQAQLRSDHATSSLSLGRITRIEDNAGRKDARGEGFELRSDAHGAIRAGGGLLITTEKRNDAEKHVLDVAETVQRLTEARDLLESGAELAQKNKAQDADDQAQVAQAVKAQIDAIRGTRPAEPGSFPEFEAPQILIGSQAGIGTASQTSTHFTSAEHTVITSGKHTSVTSGDSLLAVALKAIKLHAAAEGLELVAAQAEIQIKALEASLRLLAKDEIVLEADKISILAKSELRLGAGGSYAQYERGGIESGTTGKDIRHASGHGMSGPKGRGQPSLPRGVKAGKGQLEVVQRYQKSGGFADATYEVAGLGESQHAGRLDKEGFDLISGLAQGSTRVRLGADPRSTWEEQYYFGGSSWPDTECAFDRDGCLPSGLDLDTAFMEEPESVKPFSVDNPFLYEAPDPNTAAGVSEMLRRNPEPLGGIDLNRVPGTQAGREYEARMARMPGQSLMPFNGQTEKDREQTRQNLGAAFALPVLTPLAAGGAYAAAGAAYAGVGTIFASQAAMAPAASLTVPALLTGAGVGGSFSTGVYTVMEGFESTPLGALTAFAAGAIGGGVVKQGLNFAARLPNRFVPLSIPNAVTQGTGFAYGFGTVGWINKSGWTNSEESWWTKPMFQRKKDITE